MKKIVLLLALFASITLANSGPNQLLHKTKSNFFIQNEGQWPKEVKYLAKIGGMNAWITDFGVVYDYYKVKSDYSEKDLLKMTENEKEKYKREHTTIMGHVVRTNFIGKSINTTYNGGDKKQTYYNYFIDKDKSKWASYVPLYGAVEINEIYDGIDIRYYYDKDLLRYDFIVKPGADISQINMSLEGVDEYSVNENGELEIKISLGVVKHQDILAYQRSVKGKNETIKTLFTQKENGAIGFKVGNYNKENKLIIDPLIYSTFIGGNYIDQGRGIALDNFGGTYVIGVTGSTDYPTTSGSYDESFNNSNSIYDVFINKLNDTGSILVYCTFIGGSGEDYGQGIAIDNSGNVYATGYTASTDFPTTSGAFDESFNGVNSSTDVFITKLDATGSSLIYSTFISGSSYDEGYGIAIDNSGNVYVGGGTLSTDFPTTSGTYNENLIGKWDVFITKLNASGSGLVYSTLIGGSENEIAYGIAVDNSGNVYATGYTKSTDFPTTSGVYDETFNGGVKDVFITKLNASGSGLVYSTFIGGNNDDGVGGIAIDNSGNVYITGYTASTDYPTTNGAFNESFNGGLADVIITKLNASGSGLVYSTYVGGSDNDLGNGIVIDNSENIIVTGNTKSSGYPTTSDAFDKSFNGFDDVFITKINESGADLVYSTLFGGNSMEVGKGIAIDNSGNVFVTGYTTSTDYPTTSGAFDENFYGNSYSDVFITKLGILLVGIENENILPESFSLSQNYPNPFNPETKISFQIPAISNVTLKIYDVLGREVSILVNKEMKAGSYKVDFNASQLSSGVYFYRLTAVASTGPSTSSGHSSATAYTEIKKMVLLK